MAKSDLILIRNDKGESVEASAPVIISASRSTDIPAFYSKWFFDRLDKGYVTWINPFNGVKSYISFKNTKMIVFWSKNPKPLIPYLSRLDKLGIHYYIQYTLNDYDDEKFEPNVPLLEKRVETFKVLSSMIGPERVIWRFDPLILTDALSEELLLKKIFYLSKKLKGLTSKLVFSFIDINTYKKVKSNLVKESHIFNAESIEHAEFSIEKMDYFAKRLSDMRDYWHKNGWDFSLATCGEQIDLKKYGIEHNRCIDGELMKKLFSGDHDFIDYLNYGKLPIDQKIKQLDLFANKLKNTDKKVISTEKWKDKGQRKECGCMVAKDIGAYNTCPHGCVYCYANTSRKAATMNYKNAVKNVNGESILFKQL